MMKYRYLIDRYFSYLCKAVLLFQLLIILYFAEQKDGLFVDEIWSFNLANNYYYPFLRKGPDFFNQWLTAGDWNKTLSVGYGNIFTYDSVVYNISHDIHPPLYFLILHTVCSFFPEQYSKWLGLIPNLFFFILSQIFLGVLVYKITKSKIRVLSTCLFYGFSWGAINTALFIRAYMLITLFGLVVINFHVSALEEEKDLKNEVVKLLGIYCFSICGILSHYYFLIFLFFLSIGFCLICVCKQKIKKAIIYAGVILLSLISCTIVFEPMVMQFKGKTSQGWHVNRAIQNFFDASFFDRVELFIDYINNSIFGGLLFGVILLIIILVFKTLLNGDSYVFKLKLNTVAHYQNYLIDTKRCAYFLLFSTMLLYTLTIIKISPFTAPHGIRYLFIVFPLITLFTVNFIGALKEFCNEEKLLMVICCLIVLFGLRMYDLKNIPLMDHSYSGIVSHIREDPNIGFVAINNGTYWYPLIKKILIMKQTSQSYLIEEKKLKQLPQILKNYSKSHNSILIYRAENCKLPLKIMMDFINRKTAFKNIKCLGGEVYLLNK